MSKIFNLFLCGLLLLSTLSPLSYAGDETIMFDFYGGLADILENNMNNPGRCVSQAKGFIKKEGPKMRRIVDKAKRMSQANPYSQMNQAQMQAAMQQPTAMAELNKGMQITQKFIELFQKFAMQHPDHASKIADAFEELDLGLVGGY